MASVIETSNHQHIAPSGTGHQSHYSGQGQQISTGGDIINNHYHDRAGYNYDRKAQFSIADDQKAPPRDAKHEKAREQILQALYSIPYVERKNRNPDRVPGTCEWFMGHGHFLEWRKSESSSMLWVSANPGCGKSVLAKYLVDELAATQERTVCYFFFKDDFEEQKSVKVALSCILHQLFTQREGLFSSDVIKGFKSYKALAHNANYEIRELWDVLTMAAHQQNAGEIVCILDAFDECTDRERQDLAQLLCDFYGERNSVKTTMNLKFLITSRPYDKIRRDFINTLNIPGLPIIHLKGDGDTEVKMIAREINLYIEHKVSCIQKNLHLTSAEQRLLLQGLRAVTNQTYLWVYLTLEWIETEISINISEAEIRKVISTLPRTVDDAYEKILAKSTDAKRTKKMLHIVVAAERPLTLAEMDLALAIEHNHKSYKDVGGRPDARASEYFRNLCGLFITITDKRIYLLHQTAKEFLVSRIYLGTQADNSDDHEANPQAKRKSRLRWKSSLQRLESHRILCNICLWHLLFTEFGTASAVWEGKMGDYLDKHIFLEYSAKHWATHYRASDIVESDVTELLLQICDASVRIPTWFRIYWTKTQTKFPEDFTTLMIGSYFGLESVVRPQLLLPDVSVNSVDRIYGRSALSWASENGFGAVVDLLIAGPNAGLKRKVRFRSALRKVFRPSAPWRGAIVNDLDYYNRTPLIYATWNGHLDVVQQLIKAGGDPDIKDRIGGTAFSYALSLGQQDIANVLTQLAHTHAVDKIRRDLLWSAVKEGHEPVVKRLLDSGADMEAVGEEKTPLLAYASRSRLTDIVRLLLDKGADIDATDAEGRTPLVYAMKGGALDILEVFLRNGAKVDYSFRLVR
ncbi:hypothetical protein HDV57DRAFT_510201 [Trichoderma longibrachiatum]